MKKYHYYSRSRLVFSRIPRSLVRLLWSWKLFFDIKNNTYYPNMPHKSRWRIFWEQMNRVFEFGFPERDYYLYGLDVKGRDMREYMPESMHVDINNWTNAHPFGSRTSMLNDYNYICSLRDKYVFSLIMESMGLPIPKTFGLIQGERLFVKGSGNVYEKTIDDLLGYDLDVMCKPVFGQQGIGILHLETRQGGGLKINGENSSVEKLKNLIDKDVYLIQHYLVGQHPLMSLLYPNSINTLRVTTVRTKNGEIDVLGCMCLIGARGSFVSNWHYGGVIINVNKEGYLNKYGFSLYEKRIMAHPETGVVFETFKVPYFKESVELAKKCMTMFYGFHAVGWDIAITENGPVVIEGNDDWGMPAHQMVDKGWKEKYVQYFDYK